MRVSLLEFLVIGAVATLVGLVALSVVAFAVSHLLLTPLVGWPALSLAQSIGAGLALLLVLWTVRAMLVR